MVEFENYNAKKSQNFDTSLVHFGKKTEGDNSKNSKMRFTVTRPYDDKEDLDMTRLNEKLDTTDEMIDNPSKQ